VGLLVLYPEYSFTDEGKARNTVHLHCLLYDQMIGILNSVKDAIEGEMFPPT
jgi:hypothetical protein